MSTKLSKADSHRSILRSTSILSLGTLSSRILGFVRDVVLARILGTGMAADAFFVAFKIPNLFRSFVGEGATNSAVVPVLSKVDHQKEKADFWNFVNILFTLSLMGLSCITLVGILAAPGIVRLLAPGFIVDPEKLSLAIRLTRIIFPYLIFIGLTAYSMAVLFTFRSFWAPAFSPCLLNITMIASALIAARTMEEPVLGLAGGVLIGGILQLGVYVLPLRRVGMRYRWPRRLRHPGITKIIRLLIPRLVGSGVYQLTVLIDTFCASLAPIVGVGGISAIYYSNRIIQLPMGLFSVSLASVLLPSLSNFARHDDYGSIKRTLVFSLENIIFVMCPVMVFTIMFAHPIIRILFQRGAFDTYSTSITSMALLFYAVGLFCFGGIKVLVSVFHSLEDTKTPVKIAAGCLVLNAVLNGILMFPLKIGGIALASSLAGGLNFVLLYHAINKRLGGFRSGLVFYLGKVLLAAWLTGLAAWAFWTRSSPLHDVFRLGLMVLAGCVIYFILAYLLKVKQARAVAAWLRERIIPGQ